MAVKWILQEERSELARALYRAALEIDQPIVAPSLLPLEVTNIICQRMRVARGLSLDEATAILADFLAFRIAIHNPTGLYRQALILAHSLGLPATYDAHYLALAAHLDCDLWTDDQRLIRRVRDRLPFVRPIGEFVSMPG